jgi:hypothetical protein
LTVAIHEEGNADTAMLLMEQTVRLAHTTLVADLVVVRLMDDAT